MYKVLLVFISNCGEIMEKLKIAYGYVMIKYFKLANNFKSVYDSNKFK